MKKILLSLTSAFLLLGASSAYAESSETGDAETAIIGGTLTIVPSNVKFSSFNIDPEGNRAEDNKLVETKVIDKTGRAEGWRASLSISNFTSEVVPDNSNSSSGSTMTVSLPGDSVKLAMWGITQDPMTSQAVHETYGPRSLISSPVTVGESPVQIASADPGYGMGAYKLHTNFSMVQPKYCYVQSLSNPETSKYKLGQELGVIASEYKAVFTYTVEDGI